MPAAAGLPAFVELFESESRGRLRVSDTTFRRAEWPTLSGQGIVVHTVLGTPSPEPTAAAIVVQLSKTSSYFVELANGTASTGLRVFRVTPAGTDEPLLTVTALPRRWSGSTRLEVLWIGVTLTVFVDGEIVGNVTPVESMKYARVLLYARGLVDFDEVTAVSLQSR